jgi:hypothetical protein
VRTFYKKLKELCGPNCLLLPILDLYEFTDWFREVIANRLSAGMPFYEDIESLAQMSVIADVLQESDTVTE